jgi:hypothetical protein
MYSIWVENISMSFSDFEYLYLIWFWYEQAAYLYSDECIRYIM